MVARPLWLPLQIGIDFPCHLQRLLHLPLCVADGDDFILVPLSVLLLELSLVVLYISGSLVGYRPLEPEIVADPDAAVITKFAVAVCRREHLPAYPARTRFTASLLVFRTHLFLYPVAQNFSRRFCLPISVFITSYWLFL